MEGKRIDRLSSLPDDIVIKILCSLPLQFAIVTGCLSSRWRHLWKNIDSIDITKPKIESIAEFLTAFSNTMSQFKSPFIRSFSLEFETPKKWSCPSTYDYSWLREICDRNVSEIKLTSTYGKHFMIVFQTSSLVSLELALNIYWELPNSSINLPNLKKLSLGFLTGQCNCITKMIKACPSLEQLCLISDFCSSPEILRLSNPKLKRLALKLNFIFDFKVVISAPKLEYLANSNVQFVKINFEKEPLMLREAKIRMNSCDSHALNFNGPIAGVRFLTVNFFTLKNTTSVFHNATQVTLTTIRFYSIEYVLALMKLCPALDDLCLKYWNADHPNYKASVLPKGNLLLRRLKNIAIKISGYDYRNYKPSKSCLKLVESLLSNAINLKNFHFSIDLYNRRKTYKAERQRRELDFCKLLYNCPTIPLDCEVEFKGVFLNMSRKLGPKAWSTDGEVIALDHSPWNGFVLEED